MGIIEFNNVYFSYNNIEYIFEDVNLEIPESGITAILGFPSQGKTTLLKLIKGMLKPTRGRITVLNIDTSNSIKKQLLFLHRNVSIHFQDTYLISNMNVYDNLALPLLYNTNLSKLEIEYEIDKILNIFELQREKYEMPFNLSPTEAKLISISRAFLGNPKIILLDEPFSSLDKYYTLKLLEISEEYSKKSKIILTTSDDNIANKFNQVIEIIKTNNSNKAVLIEKD
ncbi:MAG: ATP-binding cassette domain-containing protein [Brevinematia bacterium]